MSSSRLSWPAFHVPSAPFHKAATMQIFFLKYSIEIRWRIAGFAAVKLYIHFSHISSSNWKMKHASCLSHPGWQTTHMVTGCGHGRSHTFHLRIKTLLDDVLDGCACVLPLFKENTLLCRLQKDSPTRQTDGLDRCRCLREPPSAMENSTRSLSRTSFWRLTGSIVH